MTFEIVRGLHILAVIAWMAGMLFLPRLYAYDADQAGKAEPLRSEMRGLLRTWQHRLLKIIINPSMIAAWIFGVWMIGIHMFEYGELAHEAGLHPYLRAPAVGVAGPFIDALAQAVAGSLHRTGAAPFGPGCQARWKACPFQAEAA